MQNPTLNDIHQTAVSINTRGVMYREAVRLKDEAFNIHFQSLPSQLQRDFSVLRDEYFKGAEEDKKDPDVKAYYRRAAKRFHPDTAGDDLKAPLFREATDAYRKNDLLTLQMLLLQDMATEIDHLTEDEQAFLIAQYTVMLDIADKIWDKGMETAIAAATLEQMSDNYFRTEIEEASREMATEIRKRRCQTKEALTPALLEG